MPVFKHILHRIKSGEKLLAVLLDPDKAQLHKLPQFVNKLNATKATHIFVGGSSVANDVTDTLVTQLKQLTTLPIVIFPGDTNQITHRADAVLLLSLLSGRNANYLIGKHVEAVPVLRASKLEIIPTGYILIENGKETAVERVTGTKPMPKDNISFIVDTAKAGEFLGLACIYLEAGSGAEQPVSKDIIYHVKHDITIPLIVGGGIKTNAQLEMAYAAGADMVVLGTILEEDESFFKTLKL